MSTVSSFASAAVGVRCKRNASLTWSPIVCTGESELIGSWKMIEMRPPRIPRISGPSADSMARSIAVPSPRGSTKPIVPRAISPLRGRMRMMLWLTTDLPEPDSPTSATVEPARMRKLTPLTASI